MIKYSQNNAKTIVNRFLKYNVNIISIMVVKSALNMLRFRESEVRLIMAGDLILHPKRCMTRMKLEILGKQRRLWNGVQH